LDNLVELLQQRSAEEGKHIVYTFLQDGEVVSGQITYQELERRAREIAAYLETFLVPGERALLLYHSGLEFIAAFFGCLYAQVVAVPAYPPKPNQKLARLEAIANDAQAKVALTSSSILTEIETRWAEHPALAHLHWLSTDNLPADLHNWTPKAVKPETLALLQYTSGSTGIPKGVMLSHRNLIHNEQIIQQAFERTSNQVIVSWLPLFHDMGLFGPILQTMLQPKTHCILMPPVAFLMHPIRWLKAISNYQGHISGAPNFAYELCVKKVKPKDIDSLDLSSWEVAFSGGEPVRAETLDLFAKTFAACGFRRSAFYPCYGLAENTLFVSGGEKRKEPTIINFGGRQLVSCGNTWLDQKVAIAEPQLLTRCQAGEIGEIWLSSPSVAGEYWQKPWETEQTFKAYLAEDTAKTEPFLRTGDLGFLLNGELFVTGRLKDIIIIRGQNYYPQDIELTVEKSHPALAPCGAAFTIVKNEQEKLVVVQEVERSQLRGLDVNQVIDNINQAVTAEYGLQIYAISLLKPGSIPKTSSGKIQRYACREKFLEGSLEALQEYISSSTDKPLASFSKKGIGNREQGTDFRKNCSPIREQATPTSESGTFAGGG
jgi:acyl-CoA synthetase (AMP-forming)/AMP-acid ligase II